MGYRRHITPQTYLVSMSVDIIHTRNVVLDSLLSCVVLKVMQLNKQVFICLHYPISLVCPFGM